MDTDSVESSYRDKKGHFVKVFCGLTILTSLTTPKHEYLLPAKNRGEKIEIEIV